MTLVRFDADELLRWAETYGHPEEWAQKAKAAHERAERLSELRDSIAWEAFEAGFVAGGWQFAFTSLSLRERFERWWREVGE